MKIIGYDNEYKEPLSPVKIDMWYNRPERSWVIQLKDKENNQIGEADYVATKQNALKRVDGYKKEYGIK
jgi:hypothetical protein